MERALRRFTFAAEAAEGTCLPMIYAKARPVPIGSIGNHLDLKSLAKFLLYRCFIVTEVLYFCNDFYMVLRVAGIKGAKGQSRRNGECWKDGTPGFPLLPTVSGRVRVGQFNPLHKGVAVGRGIKRQGIPSTKKWGCAQAIQLIRGEVKLPPLPPSLAKMGRKRNPFRIESAGSLAALKLNSNYLPRAPWQEL
jgi:hypothetical protein